MFAVLGDIPFQVVGSPEALSDSRSYDYAEHRVVQARPQLQWLANDLAIIRMEMLLASFVYRPGGQSSGPATDRLEPRGASAGVR